MIKEETGKPFPLKPQEQLWGAIGAVFGSWMNHRAITYRRLHDIPAEWGTAVNVQAMVFGNMGNDCATGVCFTRDPSTGENRVLRRIPGERAGRGRGRRHPHAAAGLFRRAPSRTRRRWKQVMPEAYRELLAVREKLEQHYRDMQDIEFTVQQKKLYMLQTRNGKRTAAASLRMAVDMAHEGLITEVRGGAAGEPLGARPVAASHAGPEGAAHAAGQGPAGQPRRGIRRRGVQRR